MIIEEVNSNRINCQDESIDNIVKQLPLLTEMNQNSQSKNIQQNQRITELKNENTTLIINSPLCSTPFQKKYRSKSIYKLSPILFNLDNSSIAAKTKLTRKGNIRSENDDDIQCSCECLGKSSQSIKSLNLYENDTNCDSKYAAKLYTSEFEEYNERSDSVRQKAFGSSLCTTETEPFYGFANISNIKDCSKNYDKKQSFKTEPAASYSRMNVVQNNLDTLNISKPNVEYKQILINYPGCEESEGSNSKNYDSTSFYKTCDSDKLSVSSDSSRTCNNYYLRPRVFIEKMNNSLFFKYYKKLNTSISNPDINTVGNNEINCDSYNDSVLKNNDNSIYLLNGSFDSKKEGYEYEDGNSEEKSDQKDFDHNQESKVNSEEDRCVSFVTTRRGNKLTCNSIILLDNNSFSSPFIVNKNDDIIVKGKISSPLRTEFIDDYGKTLNKSLTKGVGNPHAINNIVYRKTMECSATVPLNKITRKDPNESDTIVSKFDCDVGTDKPIVLQPGKKWERSLSIYKRMTAIAENFDHSILDDESTKYKGRRYRQSVINTMELQKIQGK